MTTHTLIRTTSAPTAQAFSGCGHGPAPTARRAKSAPPIFVNGVAIPEAAIAQEAQNHRATSAEEARAAAARALVIRELLLQRARALQLSSSPITDGEGRYETDDEALVRTVIEREVTTCEPSDSECRRVYASTLKTHPSAAAVSYEAAEPAIRERLRARAWTVAAARYVEHLASVAEIEGLTLALGAAT